MSTGVNLWGEIDNADQVKSPITILREQADLLTKITKGHVVGEVHVHRNPDTRSKTPELVAKLIIRVPALDDYQVAIVEVISRIKVYPVELRDILPPSMGYKPPDEKAFLKILGRILGSPKVKNAIASLVQQSKSL
jgi:hypothetical protein